ncbi:MAG: HrpE/YscL family type III secretion apparatus protein [Parachlamydiaceae bacterium]|nr:HrpE/YscL family type III secretion apparatus protein [Parachlamydiaceae bacterium]
MSKSQKIFTLIYGDKIKLANDRKVIPADSFSLLQDALEILDYIKKEAEVYRLDVAKEAETIKENAYKEGYTDGFNDWSERLAVFEDQLQTLQQDLQNKIVPIALSAAKKIVGREIKLSDETIVDIVINNIKTVNQHKKIVIYVNKNDLATIEKNKTRLKENFEHLESLSIRPRDDIAQGGCVIETEVGIVNAQIEHRWNVLEKAFENLKKTNPKALTGQ